MTAQTQTVDMFHRGRFVLVQPRSNGHRSGMDAMILAAAVPGHFAGKLVDLGAGSGGVALAVLSRLAGVRATLVENSPQMLGFAEATKNHPLNAHLSSRISIVAADVNLRGQARCDAGLQENAFDFALMNPPFNEHSDRQTPDLEKAWAHVMVADLWQNWLRTATALVRPGGSLALIARPSSLENILNAARGRFGALVVTPILPRPGRDAIRIIVSGKRASRQRLIIGSPLILHGANGHHFTPRTDAINNGQISLWDEM